MAQRVGSLFIKYGTHALGSNNSQILHAAQGDQMVCEVWRTRWVLDPANRSKINVIPALKLSEYDRTLFKFHAGLRPYRQG